MSLSALIILASLSGAASIELSSTSCSDLSSDSETCITHKDLMGVKSCTWCVTDNECHAVGSLENPCSNECCASESSLSSCDYDSVADVNAKTCNGTWSVKTYAPGPNPLNTIWPEEGRTSGSGNALHFCGGGSRAMTMGISQVRALRQASLFENVEYLVGVSGGGWFVSAFTYDQTSYSDDARLCPYMEPANLTDSFLADTPDGCMLSAPQCSLYECVAASGVSTIRPSNKLNEVWVDCVHKCYLSPFNIDRTALYTLEQSDVEDIKSRNPNLADEEFLLPSSAGYRPYMILDGTLIGPEDLGHFADANRTYVPVELSAFGSGIAHEQTINYEPSNSDSPVPVKVGGMVEAFGFGQTATTAGIAVNGDGVGVGYVGVNALGDESYRNGVAFSAGITSMAPEALFSQYAPKSDKTLIGGDIWPANEGSSDTSHTYMLLGDGGDLDNFGIFSSLRRAVPRAGVFVNTGTALNMSWDANERPPTSTDVDGYMSSLFGLQVFAETNDMYYTFDNQVFETDEFAPLIGQLQSGMNAGTGAVVTTTHVTIENEFMGIPAGIQITITWNYLGTPSNWYNQLPTNIQTDINDGKSGPYPGFPNYSVAHIGLSAAQVNLLANMGTWVMLENMDQYRDLLILTDA